MKSEEKKTCALHYRGRAVLLHEVLWFMTVLPWIVWTKSSEVANTHHGKRGRYPELAGDHGRARLVVVTGEIGGSFSSETAQFLRCLASDRARSTLERADPRRCVVGVQCLVAPQLVPAP